MYTKETKLYAIIFAAVFVVSYYPLRSVFSRTGVSTGLVLLGVSIVSSLVSAFFAPRLVQKNGRLINVVLLVLYFLILGVFLLSHHGEDVENTIKVGDTWRTMDGQEESFTLYFFSKDSVVLEILPDESRGTFGYRLNKEKLYLYGEDGYVLEFSVKVEGDKLIAFKNGDKLVFYKQGE